MKSALVTAVARPAAATAFKSLVFFMFYET